MYYIKPFPVYQALFVTNRKSKKGETLAICIKNFGKAGCRRICTVRTENPQSGKALPGFAFMRCVTSVWESAGH